VPLAEPTKALLLKSVSEMVTGVVTNALALIAAAKLIANIAIGCTTFMIPHLWFISFSDGVIALRLYRRYSGGGFCYRVAT
jgi:hypothetical protein